MSRLKKCGQRSPKGVGKARWPQAASEKLNYQDVYFKTWDMEGSLNSPLIYASYGVRNFEWRRCSSPSPYEAYMRDSDILE